MPSIGYTAALSVLTSGATYTAIDGVAMISIPSAEYSEVEYTHLGSTNSHKEFMPGLADGGSLEFEANWTKAGFNTLDAIKGLLANGATTISWKVTTPDEDGAGAGTAQTFVFGGFLKKLEVLPTEPDALMKMKGTVKVNGKVTVGSAS
jgi:hypothetical protein